MMSWFKRKTGWEISDGRLAKLRQFCRRKRDGFDQTDHGRDIHYGDGIVVEDGRDVFRGELVGCIADEQARLADGTVTDNDTSVAQ